MEWAEVTLDVLEGSCPPNVLKAYADKVLAGFDKDLDKMMAQVNAEAAVKPEPAPVAQSVPSVYAKESDTTDIDAMQEQLAEMQLALRKADGREVVHAALVEATITNEGKQLLERRFAEYAPEDKDAFSKEVAEEVLIMAKHEKAIAESVRLPGATGLPSEVGSDEKVDVKAVIADITGTSLPE